MKNLKNLFAHIIFGQVNEVYGFEPDTIIGTDGLINTTLIKGYAGKQKRKAALETRVFGATYVISFDTKSTLATLYINSEKEAEAKEGEIIFKLRQIHKLIDSKEIPDYMNTRLEHFEENTISFLEWEE